MALLYGLAEPFRCVNVALVRPLARVVHLTKPVLHFNVTPASASSRVESSSRHTNSPSYLLL